MGLTFQIVDVIGQNLAQIAIYIDDDGYRYGSFGCGNGNAEQSKEVTF